MGATETIRYARSSARVRALNVLLGAWLFASAFLWHHQDNVAFNDWLVGLLVAATALSAIWAPAMRWASTGLALLLGFGAVMFEYHSLPTRLHDLAVAGAILVISLVRAERAPVPAREAG